MVRNSKILVAGGTGFIGSHLISDLVANDNKVISISMNRQNAKKNTKNTKYIFHDLTKPFDKEIINALSEIEYIINCSGYIDHRDFFNDGKNIFTAHFNSLYLLTKIGIDLKVKALVQIGTSDEYGKNSSPLNESIRESPLSPYALGKLASTHYLQQCFRNNLLNTVILRPFLVFGERQNKNRFLPYLIENCMKNNKFDVSPGQQIRDYLYVKEFNRALIKALETPKAYGEIINIASGIPLSIKDVILSVKNIIGKGKPNFGGKDYRNGESMELYADIEKAKRILDWKPEVDFKKGLTKVIDWHRGQ